MTSDLMTSRPHDLRPHDLTSRTRGPLSPLRSWQYFTQPLPNPLSGWAHRLPAVAHRAAVLGTLLIEIVMPLCAYLPHRTARYLTCASFVGLHAVINLSGSYGFIGALSVVESLSLLDDDVLVPWLMPGVLPADVIR